jgi:plastocyanin
MNMRMNKFGLYLAVPSLMLGLIGLSACSMLAPPTTRSGEVHDVKIEEALAPAILTVGIGDEVRWVNHRAADVRVDFLDGALDDVSCQRGFTNWMGMQKESTIVGANKSASLCFEKAGVVTYNVRMDSSLPGGKQIVQGEIRVGRSRGPAGGY